MSSEWAGRAVSGEVDMNEALNLGKWIGMTPDRVILIAVLLLVIFYLLRRTEKQSAQLAELHKTSEARGVEIAGVVTRNNQLFERVMKRLEN